MDDRSREDRPVSDVSRRTMLKRIGAGAAIAWSAPVLTSLRVPAFAQEASPACTGCETNLCGVDPFNVCGTSPSGDPCVCAQAVPGGPCVCNQPACGPPCVAGVCPEGFVCHQCCGGELCAPLCGTAFQQGQGGGQPYGG